MQMTKAKLLTVVALLITLGVVVYYLTRPAYSMKTICEKYASGRYGLSVFEAEFGGPMQMLVEDGASVRLYSVDFRSEPIALQVESDIDRGSVLRILECASDQGQ